MLGGPRAFLRGGRGGPGAAHRQQHGRRARRGASGQCRQRRRRERVARGEVDLRGLLGRGAGRLAHVIARQPGRAARAPEAVGGAGEPCQPHRLARGRRGADGRCPGAQRQAGVRAGPGPSVLAPRRAAAVVLPARGDGQWRGGSRGRAADGLGAAARPRVRRHRRAASASAGHVARQSRRPPRPRKPPGRLPRGAPGGARLVQPGGQDRAGGRQPLVGSRRGLQPSASGSTRTTGASAASPSGSRLLASRRWTPRGRSPCSRRRRSSLRRTASCGYCGSASRVSATCARSS
mmetsp:Transcript_10996/g.31290  ORF Transcript_10996/g.31290 Transcript_10996/m.31290 type:complete len:292 (+) Transcript_10996:270-1145(+)